MKPLLQISAWLLASMSITPTWAQIHATIDNSFALGVSAGELGYDAGVSLEVSTPAFCKNKIHLRMKGSMTWLEAYKATYDHWTTYKTINASLVYNFSVIDRARPYTEIGATFIFPTKTFSDSKGLGVTCSIGVELFVITRPGFNICYYFSGGGTYSQADAEEIENKPRYANGFVFNNGFRIYF